jgi:hypothetical protein
MSRAQVERCIHEQLVLSVVEIQPGRSYGGGTRLHLPRGAASFVVPRGWQAQLPEDSEALILTSDSGTGFLMVVMILDQSEEAIMALMDEPQAMTHEMIFQPVRPAEKQGNRVTAAYDAGSLAGRAVTVLGPNQQGVLFFLAKPRIEWEQPDRLLNELADSAEFVFMK